MAIRFYAWKDKFKRKKRTLRFWHRATSWPGAPAHTTRPINRAQRNNNRHFVRCYRKGFIDEGQMSAQLKYQHRQDANFHEW